MKTLQEMIAVMQAAADGKAIECISSGTNWDRIAHPCWNWANYDYRVKPEPKLRPWAGPSDVPFGIRIRWKNTPLHGWMTVTSVSPAGVCVGTVVIPFNRLRDEAEYDRGDDVWQDCGILEES